MTVGERMDEDCGLLHGAEWFPISRCSLSLSLSNAATPFSVRNITRTKKEKKEFIGILSELFSNAAANTEHMTQIGNRWLQIFNTWT